MPHADHSPNVDLVTRFFEALHGEQAGEDALIVLWALKQGEKSPMIGAGRDPGEAAQIAGKMNLDGWDVYHGCSLQPRGAVSTTRRGSAATAVVGRCVWVDLDMKDAVGYPGSLADVGAALKRMPLPPTMVVETSEGGRHLYWVFNDPMEDSQQARRLLTGWIETCRLATGFRLDSVGDPARVMRIPGLWRPGTETMVEMLSEFGPIYEPEDLEELLPDDLVTANAVEVEPADIFVSPTATVNSELLEVAMDVDVKFANLWNRKTNTRTWKDTSQSAWDWALLANAAELGWPAQDLADLGVAYRLKCAEKLTGFAAAKSIKKAARTDYWADIVARVMLKSPAGLEEAVRRQEKALVDSGVGDGSEALSESEGSLALAVEALGVPAGDGLVVHEVVAYYGEGVDVWMRASARGRERTFRLEDGADTLYFHTRLASALRCALRVAVPVVPQKQWAPHGNLMIRHMKDAEIADAGSGQEILRTLVNNYLEVLPPLAELAEEEKVLPAAFRHDGDTYVRFTPLLEWLRSMGERHNFASLSKWLTTAGLVSVKIGGVKAWKL